MEWNVGMECWNGMEWNGVMEWNGTERNLMTLARESFQWKWWNTTTRSYTLVHSFRYFKLFPIVYTLPLRKNVSTQRNAMQQNGKERERMVEYYY